MKNKIAGHTPGPWKFEPNPRNLEYIRLVEKREPEPHEGYMRDNDGGWYVPGIAKVLCKTSGKKYDRMDNEGQANARLIAAAPDLLAFAEATAQTFGPDTMISKEARAAIAKAKGES